MKQIIGAIAVLLTFVSYLPYFRDIIRGKTHPHLYSWCIWGLLTVIIFALQIKYHGGPGSFVTLAAGLMCLIVIVLSIRHGQRDITRADTIVSILALLAIVLWLFAKQPLLSAILATVADVLAFVPTIRKSWFKPYTETLSLYVTNVFRFGLALLALASYTSIAVLYPLIWLVANALFSVMLIIRRRQLGVPSK